MVIIIHQTEAIKKKMLELPVEFFTSGKKKKKNVIRFDQNKWEGFFYKVFTGHKSFCMYLDFEMC